MLGGVSAVLEFAVSAMKVEHIAVCGHSDCGAMKGLLNPEAVESMPTVRSWLTNAHAALSVARAIQQATGDPDLLRIVTEQNVLLQMQHVRTHPAVAGAMARGELAVSGWIYDIARGEVSICADGGESFELVDWRA
jgi:carbonic anhydrase